MRRFIFSLFKTFVSVSKKLKDFFSRKGLGRIPGVRTLHRLMHLQYDWMYYKLKPKGIVLMDIQGNRMYVNTDDRGIAPMLLMDGVMEKYETELFKEMVKEGMVVVDIGANIGYYSLIVAKLVGDNGIVYAFEPEPFTYELLCKNIEINGYANVVPVQKAVSNKLGKVKLWVDKAGIAISSFSKDNVLAFSKDKISEKPSFLEVETISLDEFLENTVKNNRVDIIKVDTQGAEGFIIEGAKNTLESNNVKIAMEFWPGGLRNMGTDPLELLYKLQEYGFKINSINGRRQTLEPIENIEEFCRKAKPGQEFNLLLQK